MSRFFLWVLAILAFGGDAEAREGGYALAVHSLLNVPEGELSFENSKLELDQIINPSLSGSSVSSMLSDLASAAIAMSDGGDEIDRLRAVQKVIYQAGPWNGGQPFTYNHSDPFGDEIESKLLGRYLEDRRGNCVSMPVLQLVLAERLGLNVSLSTAPNHVFLRYTNPRNGRSIAIESTSGGHPARETEYYEKMGVTQEQVDNGIYLAVLTKRESIAVMANTVVEWLLSEKRYAEAVEVADVILEVYPKDIHTMAARGKAYGEMLNTEFLARYAGPAAIPEAERSRFELLVSSMRRDIDQVDAWGWQQR